MSRIDIAVPANTAPSATAAPSKGAQTERDTKLDDVFQKLIKKLNGELAKGKNDKDAPITEEPKVEAKKPVKPNGPKASVRDDLVAGKTTPDREEPVTENVEPGIHVEADARTKLPTLPELLQSLPVNAKAEKSAVAADLHPRQAAPVATNARKAGADAKDGGVPDKADGPGRNPFTALTSILARENIGTDADPVVPEPPAKSPKFTLVTRETHFEPVVRTPPVQQVADIIVANIATAAAAAEDAGEVVTTGSPASPELESLSLRTPSDGPLKILHIKLEPYELGEVSVKMRLVGGSLEVRLEASRAETADLLMRDKDMLHKLLRASGYSPDVVTIQAVGESSSSQSTSNQTGQNGASAQNPSPFQGGENSDGRRQGDETAPVHDQLPSSENAYDDAPAADGNLYL